MFKIEKDIMIILGNGISIDLVNKLEMVDKINLSNLFSNGDKVRWPGNNEPGFLSQQWCPALWELGARPGISNGKTSKIIEDVITCANVSASSEHPSIDGESSNIYIKAYHELVLYLRYLFIFYNLLTLQKINDIYNKIFSFIFFCIIYNCVNICYTQNI